MHHNICAQVELCVICLFQKSFCFDHKIMVLLGKKDLVSGCRTVLQVKVSFASTQPATIPVASITYQGS